MNRTAKRPAIAPRMRAATLAALALAPLLLSGCARLVGFSTGALTVEPADLEAELPGALIIDLRDPGSYAAGHIPGAINLQFSDVNGYLHGARPLGDRPVVLACDHGVNGALAVPTARYQGFSRPFALAGGMERWKQLGLPLETAAAPADGSRSPPVLVLTRFQQLVTFVSGLVIKPTYMVISLVLLAWLRRRATTTPLRILWHGLLWFFVGEAFCAVNLAYHLPGRIYTSDVLHGAGMVAMSALIPWGLYALFDERVLRFSDPAGACRAQALCGRCWKREPVRCGFHDLMFLVAVGGAVVSLMPLSLDLRPVQMVTSVLGAKTDVGVPIVNHLFELRIYPLLGSATFLVTLLLLQGGPRSVRRAEPAFFAAVGFMSYSLLRFLLSSTFRDALYWSDFWEELTELLFIAGIALFLLLFRRQLGLAGEAAVPQPAADAASRP